MSITKKKKNIAEIARITTTGTLSNIMEFLPESTKEYLVDPPKEAQAFVDAFIKGFAGSIKLCYPEKCPHRDVCPLYKSGRAPKGHFCPYEALFTDARFQEYLALFPEPTGADIISIMNLVAVQLLINRVEGELSRSELVIEEPKLATEDGELYFEKKPHPLLQTLLHLRKLEKELKKELFERVPSSDMNEQVLQLWESIKTIEAQSED